MIDDEVPGNCFREKNGMKNGNHTIGGRNRKNAPSFVYEILYGKPKFLTGRTIEHHKKIWNGIPIDAHLPTDALEKLNRMEEIELRSSCEGSGPERPTYLVFRLKGPEDTKKAENFVKAMNIFEDVESGFGRGNRGLIRIGVTTPLWYEKNPEKFYQWWRALPLRFAIVLAVIQILGQESEREKPISP